MGTGAAALLLAGALIRLGFVPFGWAADDAARAHPCLGILMLGPMRAQGILLAVYASSTHRSVAYAAAAAAAATAVVASGRGIQRAGIATAGLPAASLAVLGFGLGGALATWGAVLCLAASFLVVPVWSAGEGWRDVARPALGALPAGALLPGATLVATAALQSSIIRPAFLLLAVPAAAAAAASGSAAAVGRSGGARGDRAFAGVLAGVSLAGALALVAAPARMLGGIAFPVADALGVGRLLSVRGTPGIAENLAAVMAIAAVVAFVLGPGRTGSGGASGRRSPGVDRWLAWWACAPLSAGRSASAAARAESAARRLDPAIAVLVAAAIGLALKVYVAAAGRGFL